MQPGTNDFNRMGVGEEFFEDGVTTEFHNKTKENDEDY